jgi:vacuolar iron transporter family protein
LQASLIKSAGTVVFGMEDGTVSIFGLIFGVAATTSNTATVVIAGATGAVAAAVSMMAGVYLDAETTRDALAAKQKLARSGQAFSTSAIVASLPDQLAAAGLTSEQCSAPTEAVRHDRAALDGLMLALQVPPDTPDSPWDQALWMLLADFAAAAVPILPFVWLPIPQARVVSGAVTLLLLVGLGIRRAHCQTRYAAHGCRDSRDRHRDCACVHRHGVLVNSGFGG